MNLLVFKIGSSDLHALEGSRHSYHPSFEKDLLKKDASTVAALDRRDQSWVFAKIEKPRIVNDYPFRD